jgi:hypothetical protein
LEVGVKLRRNLSQASGETEEFKLIFKLQNYKINYSLNTKSWWWSLGLSE